MPHTRYLVRVLLVAAVYFAVAKLGLLAAVAQRVVSSAWPPAGFALAALLLFGTRLWPGVYLGAFLLNATSGVSAPGAAGIAVGNTLEAVVGVWLLRRARFDRRLERLRDVAALVVLGAVVATTIGATNGVAHLLLSGAIRADAYAGLWLVWWSGDALGVLVFAPLLLAWWGRTRPQPRRGTVVEAGVVAVALVLLTEVLFRTPLPFAYMVFPVACWAAIRFGPRGAAAATAAVAALAVLSTVRGGGPFVQSAALTNLFLLQTFLALLSLTTLVLAAAIGEREQARVLLETELAERRRAEQLLSSSRTELRALSRRLLGSQEQERARLARDLHDQIGQVLNAVRVNLEGLLRHDAEEWRRVTQVRESLSVVETAIEQVRTLSFDLRPPMLDELGLGPAVAAYCRRQAFRADLALTLGVAPELGLLPKDVQTACFRILQEAVTNTVGHAGARQLSVELRRYDGTLLLVVRDDGVGFDAASPPPPDGSAWRLGILDMAERAHLVGGRMDVESAPQRGTVVRAWFPVEAGGADDA